MSFLKCVSARCASVLVLGAFSNVGLAESVKPPQIEIDFSQAALGGKGCSFDDGATLSSATANELIIGTPKFLLNLNSSVPNRAARLACTVVVPAKVPQGYFVESVSLKGQFLFGKSSGSDLGFSFAASVNEILSQPNTYHYATGVAFAPQEIPFMYSSVFEPANCSEDIVLKVNYGVSVLRNSNFDWSSFSLSNDGISVLNVILKECTH